jgi:competence protein ComEA
MKEPTRIIGGLAARRILAGCALCALVATVAITLATPTTVEAGAKPGVRMSPKQAASSPQDNPDDARKLPRTRADKKELVGRLNLNSATEDQLQLLPGVGPAKAQRIVEYRGKKGPFKRVADLRKVKGFGYKSLKTLEPYLDVKGETNLAVQ